VHIIMPYNDIHMIMYRSCEQTRNKLYRYSESSAFPHRRLEMTRALRKSCNLSKLSPWLIVQAFFSRSIGTWCLCRLTLNRYSPSKECSASKVLARFSIGRSYIYAGRLPVTRGFPHSRNCFRHSKSVTIPRYSAVNDSAGIIETLEIINDLLITTLKHGNDALILFRRLFTL